MMMMMMMALRSQEVIEIKCFFTGNLLAIWCVVGCSRTPPAVKILLCALFSSTLLMCLLVMPFMAHAGVSKVRCDGQIHKIAIRVIITLYIILTEIELLYITLMALLR